MGRKLAMEIGLGAVVLAVLLVAFRTATVQQVPGILVVTIAVSVLARVRILLTPAGEISLAPLITLPTVFLFGWQPAVLGAGVGIATTLLARGGREVLVRESIQIPALAAAEAATVLAGALGPPLVLHMAVGCAVYFLAVMAFESTRLCVAEMVDWPRGVRYVLGAWSLHAGVFTVLVLASVTTAGDIPWQFGRYIIPVLASLVAVQLYLPRIFRGEEEQRVHAAVAIMASAIDAKDPYTGDHSLYVANLSLRIARLLGLDETAAHRVYLASLVHDIGKVIVPPDILNKPTPLTAGEVEIMRGHVVAGATMLRSIAGLEDISSLVAASHEHMDGSGYPEHLRGQEIPLGSRINLVVDAFNALITDRPYRVRRSPLEAFQEIQAHAGSQFDPAVVGALGTVIGFAEPAPGRQGGALSLLRSRSFALLYAGELVSYLGDEVFYIALSLWVYQLTGSAVLLATTLVAATLGQGLFGLLAGAVADRVDRRAVIIATDVARAVLIALLPLVLPRSLPLGLVILLIASIGTVFYRSGLLAMLPTIVAREQLGTATALVETTARIAEVVGGVLGGSLVVLIGYHLVFYLNALSFLGSALAVSLIPLAWRAGVSTSPRRALVAEIGEGLKFIWHTPIHRFLGLLILPGSLTLGFTVLQAPMVVGTAHLSAVAFGVVNSALGLGKFVAAFALAGAATRWVSPGFVVGMFLVTSLGIAIFGASPLYPGLIMGAFVFGFGNVATTIGNATLSMASAPKEMVGRLMASRQVFIAFGKVVGLLVFGRLADLAGAPVSLIVLAIVSCAGILAVWGSFRHQELPWGGPEAPRVTDGVALAPDGASADVVASRGS